MQKIRESEIQDHIGIVQRGDSSEVAELDYHRLKTMVKRSIEQNLRINFGARNGNAVVNSGAKQREQRILGYCWQWESNWQCSRGDTCSFRDFVKKKNNVATRTQSNPSPNSFMQQNQSNASRTRSPRGKSSTTGWNVSMTLEGLPWRNLQYSFCEKRHPPESLFYKIKSGCRFGEKCAFAHRQVDEQPTKRSKTKDGKSAVAMLKKGNWQGREPVTDECHDRPEKPGKRSDKK